MQDEQVERLLEELVRTRESFDSATVSFDAAIKQIKWNRINTIIQYALIAIVLIMLFFGSIYYLGEKNASCERGNDLRSDISDSLDSNALAIGAALVIVTGAPQERFDDYIDAYAQQNKPEVLTLRNC
jgi:hypothetical protein